MKALSKLSKLTVFRLNIARCNLGDDSLDAIIGYLQGNEVLEEFELHVHGNDFSVQNLGKLIEVINSMKLRKLVMSFYEYNNASVDDKYETVIEAFEKLEISEKKLI